MSSDTPSTPWDVACAGCSHTYEQHAGHGPCRWCDCECFESPEAARFELRVSRTELATWKARAEGEGLSLAAYIRQHLKMSRAMTPPEALGHAVERALRASLNSIDTHVAVLAAHWSCPRCRWQHEAGTCIVEGYGGTKRCNACGAWS